MLLFLHAKNLYNRDIEPFILKNLDDIRHVYISIAIVAKYLRECDRKISCTDGLRHDHIIQK
jgi:hypothetical protein